MPITPANRRITPEQMDDPNLDALLHRNALKGLARLNRVSNAAAGLRRPLSQMHRVWAAQCPPQKQLADFRVLDIACGSADVTRSLALKTRRLTPPVAWTGVDISPIAIQAASSHAACKGIPRTRLRFTRLDALNDAIPTGYDLCIISLFLHHLPTPSIIDLLARIAAVCPRILVSDLNRSAPTRIMVNAAARMVTRSTVVHHDADASVCAAFTLSELKQIAAAAGLVGCRVQHQFPCRLLLTWTAPA